MNWDDVRLFLALARSGSARAAADALAVSHTTVARRIEQLESTLQVRLFDRDVRGFRLTEAGEAMLGSATRAEDALMAAQRQLQGRDTQLTGEIRLTCSDVIVDHLLMPGLADFSRQYPEIDLTVMLSNDLFDLARREADVAIRVLRVDSMPPEDLIGRKVLTLRSSYYAAPSYLAKHDPTHSASGARWIGWSDRERNPDWVRRSPFPDLPAFGCFNDPKLQAQAALHGMGLAVLPCFIGDDVAGLQRVGDTEPYDSFDLWVLSHPDLRDTARLRVFRRYCAELLEAQRGRLTGTLPA